MQYSLTTDGSLFYVLDENDGIVCTMPEQDVIVLMMHHKNVHMQPDVAIVRAKVLILLDTERFINAIKAYREATLVGLSEAKTYVEGVREMRTDIRVFLHNGDRAAAVDRYLRQFGLLQDGRVEAVEYVSRFADTMMTREVG